MTRIPVYIRTEQVGHGLPPERTYTFNSEGDAVLLGTVVKPGEMHRPEAWSPVEIVRRAIEGRWGFRWEPRDMAVPAPSLDPDNPAATEAGERHHAAACRAGEEAPVTTLKDAAHALWEHFEIGSRSGAHPYVQCIAVGACDIKVMLTRTPHPFERPIPIVWQGYPVETRIVGKLWTNGSDPDA